MKKALFSFILLCIIVRNFSPAQAGSDGLAFLKLGVGGRSLGMGEAYSAIASDPTATFYNPAAMSLSKSPQLFLMHKSWIQDTRTDYLAAQTYFGNFNFGLALNFTSVDNIEFRLVPGPPEGTFSSRNASMGISTSYSINPSLALGGTVNFLYEKIFTSDASGLGYNFGVLYQTPWDIRTALVVNNLGSMSVLGDQSTKLPTSVRIGAAKPLNVDGIGPNSTMTFAADIVDYTVENKAHLHLGGELNYENIFAMRLGYMTGYDARSITAGVGVKYSLIYFDYAYAPFRYDLGTTHTFSLGFNF
ncbi:MAG: PorV/PorQ family protein [Bacteroidota bacterium]